MPALSILQPAKVATPATAALGLVVQVRVAPRRGREAQGDRAVLPVTLLPPASCTVTTGWVKKATPALENEGSVVKASRLAGPVVMVKSALTSVSRAPDVAVRV